MKTNLDIAEIIYSDLVNIFKVHPQNLHITEPYKGSDSWFVVNAFDLKPGCASSIYNWWCNNRDIPGLDFDECVKVEVIIKPYEMIFIIR